MAVFKTFGKPAAASNNTGTPRPGIAIKGIGTGPANVSPVKTGGKKGVAVKSRCAHCGG